MKKENRRNSLEKKLRKQEFYGKIEELFDPPINTLKAYGKKIIHS